MKACFKFIFIFLLCSQTVLAQHISLDLPDINLVEAIRQVAKFSNRNVIISPAVQGMTSIHLVDAEQNEAFYLLLTANGLAAWQQGNVWFVAPHTELIRRRQEELKWQEISLGTETIHTKIYHLRYAKAEDFARLIQYQNTSLLSKRGRIRVDQRTNSLCVQDVEAQLIMLEELIQKLDVPIKQIRIEARLAAVDSDFERELGVRFAVRDEPRRESNVPESLHAAQGQYSLLLAKLPDGTALDVKLAALESSGHAELISSPSLFTANQQPASIESGEEVPYQESSLNGATTVVFKKAVLSLKVIPQVLPGNKILLQLHINQDRPSNHQVLGVPTISTRQISTNVLVQNGQTIVLGGIYETSTEYSEEALPFISKIPIVGLLFKQQDKRNRKRELLIFVTPKMI